MCEVFSERCQPMAATKMQLCHVALCFSSWQAILSAQLEMRGSSRDPGVVFSPAFSPFGKQGSRPCTVNATNAFSLLHREWVGHGGHWRNAWGFRTSVNCKCKMGFSGRHILISFYLPSCSPCISEWNQNVLLSFFLTKLPLKNQSHTGKRTCRHPAPGSWPCGLLSLCLYRSHFCSLLQQRFFCAPHVSLESKLLWKTGLWEEMRKQREIIYLLFTS